MMTVDLILERLDRAIAENEEKLEESNSGTDAPISTMRNSPTR
ncbi:hypothetical protein [Bradyrhizobium sp. DOA1]|nr:hypothetical protein [Bradyrhizobium sp. DOA1]